MTLNNLYIDSIGVNRLANVREIPYLPSFRQYRIFAKTSRIFGFIMEKIKFAENRDNFQLHGDILCTEAV